MPPKLEKAYYTTREAAQLAGITTMGLREAIRAGRLKARRFGTSYMITRRNLEVYLEKREIVYSGGKKTD